jgi:cytochrome c-type biogenesis protein CcmH/NrfG
MWLLNYLSRYIPIVTVSKVPVDMAASLMSSTLMGIAARLIIAQDLLETGRPDKANEVIKRLLQVLPKPSSKHLLLAKHWMKS